MSLLTLLMFREGEDAVCTFTYEVDSGQTYAPDAGSTYGVTSAFTYAPDDGSTYSVGSDYTYSPCSDD